MADLSKTQDLLAYLASTRFAATGAVSLTGGTANHVFRVRLQQPYHGHATAVVKHAKALEFGGLKLGVDRQKFEVDAMKLVAPLLAAESLLRIPEIYLYDEKEQIVVLEDCGEDILTLKEFLLRTTNPPSQADASAIGVALADFLAQLHAWGVGNTSVLDLFEQNKQARIISAWATYGRVQSTLSGADSIPSLTNLGILQADLETVGQIAANMRELILTSRDTLVQGDFWPGNVMIKLREGKQTAVERIYVLDWELAKPGSPGVEVGQFLGELYQAQHFCEPNAEVIGVLQDTFLSRYREKAGGTVDMKEAARRATIHMGAHLTAWTPRVWFGKEDAWTREMVLTGLEYMLHGLEGKDIESKATRGLLRG